MKTTLVQTLHKIETNDGKYYIHAALTDNTISLKPKNGNMFNFTLSKPEDAKAVIGLMSEALKLLSNDNRTKSASSKKTRIRTSQARSQAKNPIRKSS